MEDDLFNGLFLDKLEIDEAKTIDRARTLLKQYKKIYQIASVVKEPGMTKSYSVNKPTFSIGQFFTDGVEKNQMTKAVEKQMIAQDLIEDIISGVNNMYIESGEPTAYYVRFIYIVFMDFSVRNHLEARKKLAKEFPNRVGLYPNDVLFDEQVYFYDLRKCLLAFANSYKSNETTSLLVYKN